ncbi:MAG: hypothetical protein AB7V77_02370 [Candidatus Woesearchaeota archaeon]
MRFEHSLFLVLALFLLIPLVLSINFSSTPQIIGLNITTTDDLHCTFSVLEDGFANITWYNGSNHFNESDANNIIVSDETYTTTLGSGSVPSSVTLKNQNWKCSVTLFNSTDTLSPQNSSTLTILNSKPTITTIIEDNSIYIQEDVPYVISLTATDADGDTLYWRTSNYLEEDPSYPATGNNIDMTIIGRHEDLDGLSQNSETLSITVEDKLLIDGLILNVTINETNDAPYFTSPTTHPTHYLNCTENLPCEMYIYAEDEENDYLNFTTNNTILTINNFDAQTGYFTFTPTQQQSNKIYSILLGINDSKPENNFNSTILILNISTIDHAPNITSWSSSNAIQNQTTNFIFTINATDEDNQTMTFEIENTGLNCTLPDEMWNLTLLNNGTGGTNATAMINVSFTNNANYTSNDFVACRDVNFIVSSGDASLTDEQTITFNITNINDAPIIYNESYFSETVGVANNNNISNLSAWEGTIFSYKVNATDIDFLTYESNIETLTYTINNTFSNLFYMNSSTGILKSTELINNISYSQQNYSIKINVTDTNGAYYFVDTTIHIISNTIPEIIPTNNSNCIEDSVCEKNLSAIDPDLDYLGNDENLSMTLSCLYKNPLENSSWENCSLTTYFVDDNTTTTIYKFNFTPSNNQVGQYNITVTFNDSYDASDSETFMFNITNINDAPNLDDNSNPIIFETIDFNNVVADIQTTEYIYAYDEDLYYNYDNLTINFSFLLGNLSTNKFNFTQTNNTYGYFQILPEQEDIGNYSINITVQDMYNETSWQTLNFTVYNNSLPPEITQIKPYFNGSELVLLYTDITTETEEDINLSETNTTPFGVIAVDAINSSTPTNYTYYWYFDDILKQESNTNTYSHHFNYSSQGNKTIKVIVEDEFYSTSDFTWNINVSNINRNPIFNNSLNNLSINTTTDFPDFFNLENTISKPIIFYDIDDDLNLDGKILETNNLNFSVHPDSTCIGDAEFIFSDRQLTIQPLVITTCDVIFTATDPYGASVDSNQIRLNLTATDEDLDSPTESGTRTITERITVPIQEEVFEPEEFKLIYPGLVAIYANGTVQVPIYLRNTKNEDLRNIYLSANSSTDELSFTFSKNYIDSLSRNSDTNVTLTIENYRVDAPLEVNVTAEIQSLDYLDVSVIYINALEASNYMDKQSLQTRLGFARDLLSDNSECQELTEILNSAEKMNTANSLELINSVINACKYLMNEEKSASSSTPKSFLGKTGVFVENYVDFKVLLTLLGAFIFVAIGIGIFSKFSLKKI